MNVDGVRYRTIALEEDGWGVRVIDQTALPGEFRCVRLDTLEEAARAIEDMLVRGAPLIGATAAYGVALAMRSDPSDTGLEEAIERLLATRPTAVNLRWALDRARSTLAQEPPAARAAEAYAFAADLCDDDVELNRAIGDHGALVLAGLRETRPSPLNVLTHCNAGWLATVDWGTATAPLYRAHDDGVSVHVWVDETRPRLQGAALTAWELGKHGVPHTLIADSAAAHLMRRGEVDVVLVGTDRTTRSGDVVNKIGTYPLALAASDNGVPFYVAVPSPSIDWTIDDGNDVPIEERAPEELTHVRGQALAPGQTPALNIAFDVTPRHLVTGLITERGVCEPERASLLRLFPEAA